jgi:pimeloyl-[acyl-carrier protein] methyl ester esterase
LKPSIIHRTISAFVAPISLAGCLSLPAISSAAAMPAQTARLFSDSRVVVQPRFSDEIVGHGPDLIFIPGLASSRETWKATADRLKDRYRLHLIQIAGFAGEMARANGSGDVLVPTAEALDAYIAANHLAPAVVIGHSLGATTALYLVEHHPEHYKKVLLVDCLPFFGVLIGGAKATPDSIRPIAEKIHASMSAATPAAYDASEQQIRPMVTGKEGQDKVIAWGRASDRPVVGEAMMDDMMLDLRPGLAAVQTPVTVFYPDNVSVGAPKGAMDGFYGAAFAPMPHKTLVRFDDSRHFIMFDQPDRFEAELDTFLAQ